MKKLLTLVIAILAFSTAWSQTDVKINPIGALFGSPDISAEFAINESTGIEPFIGVTFRNYAITDVTYKSNGFGLGAIGKYYFNPEKGMDKFWTGLYLRGGNSTSTGTFNGTAEEVGNARVALGFAAGYKWVSSRNIVFELGIGIGRAFYNKYTNKTAGSIDLSKFPIANIDGLGRLQVGYRFGSTGSTASKKKKK